MIFTEENTIENSQLKIAKMLENNFKIHALRNLMLIVSTEKSVLRFVRDRGYNTCEICDDEELQHWIDDVSISFSDPLRTDSFYKYVEYILTLKGLKKD